MDSNQTKKQIEMENDTLKETINNLRTTIYENDNKIRTGESSLRMREEEIRQYKKEKFELVEKLTKQNNIITEIRSTTKKFEKENTMVKLSYESIKEQIELLMKENEIHVMSIVD